MGDFSARILIATFTSPTGARITRLPASAATSSTMRLVERLVTTTPFRWRSPALAANAVEADAKRLFANSFYVEEGQRQDLFNVFARGVLVLRDGAELVPCRAGNRSLNDFSHLRGLGGIEKESRRSDKLECVP